MKTIYIHLGYHKTATTFLQRFVYPHMQQVNFVRLLDIRQPLRRIKLKPLQPKGIRQVRRAIMAHDDGRPMLISYEGLSASPFSKEKKKRNVDVLADLRRVFPADTYNVQVIIGIRQQVDLLTSLYVQHLHQGGVMGPEAYMTYCEHNGSLGNFHFYHYLQSISEVFPESRHHVMVYEQFKQDTEGDIRKLMTFMGEEELPDYETTQSMRMMNKSYGTMQVAVARQLNKLFRSNLNRDGRLALFRAKGRGRHPVRLLLQNRYSYGLHYKKYQFPEALQQRLRAQYRDGNRRLAETYDLTLPDHYF